MNSPIVVRFGSNTKVMMMDWKEQQKVAGEIAAALGKLKGAEEESALGQGLRDGQHTAKQLSEMTSAEYVTRSGREKVILHTTLLEIKDLAAERRDVTDEVRTSIDTMIKQANDVGLIIQEPKNPTDAAHYARTELLHALKKYKRLTGSDDAKEKTLQAIEIARAELDGADRNPEILTRFGATLDVIRKNALQRHDRLEELHLQGVISWDECERLKAATSEFASDIDKLNKKIIAVFSKKEAVAEVFKDRAAAFAGIAEWVDPEKMAVKSKLELLAAEENYSDLSNAFNEAGSRIAELKTKTGNLTAADFKTANENLDKAKEVLAAMRKKEGGLLGPQKEAVSSLSDNIDKAKAVIKDIVNQKYSQNLSPFDGVLPRDFILPKDKLAVVETSPPVGVVGGPRIPSKTQIS